MENQQNSSRKRAVRWLVFAVVLVLVVWGTVKMGGKSNDLTGGQDLTAEVQSGEWTRGPEGAPLTLIEYADFQCPACATYLPVIEELRGEFGDNLRLVFRHFPLRTIHKNADEAGYAAEAAGKQGKFWEMHDLIYKRQTEWKDLGNPESKFTEYANSLDLNAAQFKTDYNSDGIKDKIDQAYSAATKAGLSATPTFVLNGKKIQPRNYEEFKNILTQELSNR